MVQNLELLYPGFAVFEHYLSQHDMRSSSLRFNTSNTDTDGWAHPRQPGYRQALLRKCCRYAAQEEPAYPRRGSAHDARAKAIPKRKMIYPQVAHSASCGVGRTRFVK